MNDANGKTATALAVTEKRQSNSGRGGYVGILFQLFDWHRRFAKKKLFTRKWLPSPARGKEAVKKFKGDEKMPAAKLHLVDDENKGGFPRTRKNGSLNLDTEQKKGTQAPGLVARLMGLESMPLVQQKVNRNSPCETYNGKRDQLMVRSRVLGKEDLNVEKGHMKNELRPPKLQKTGQLDGRAVIRYGAEALQIKNVWRRSGKYHHQKLLSPVKTPRITSGSSMSRTTSRLIDAAAKILEPGLQSKNRTKCALPYSPSMRHALVDGEMAEKSLTSPDVPRQIIGNENLAIKPSMGQSPCKNCGNLLDIVTTGQSIILEQTCNDATVTPYHVYNSDEGAGIDKRRPPGPSVVPQKAKSHKGRQQESLGLISPSVENFVAQDHNDRQIKDVKPSRECRDEWTYGGQKRNPHRGEMPVEERIIHGSRNANLKSRRVSLSSNTVSSAKDFITLNRRLSGRTRPRDPARADGSGADVVRRARIKGGESTSLLKPPLQKMTIEHPNCAGSLAKQKRRNELSGGVNRSRCSEANDGVVSFTFHSPMRDRAGNSDKASNNRRDMCVFNVKESSQSKSGLGENYPDGAPQKHFALSGDALGAFLEQKLKELTSQEEEEAAISCKRPKMPTAVILAELMAALTAEPSLSEYDAIADAKEAFQMKPSIYDAAGILHDVNPFSPGSVLEASFSNDSCISGSFDDVSGSKLHADLRNYSANSSQPLGQDMELLDSATSLNMGGTHVVELTSLIDQVARIMDGLILAEVRLTGGKVNLAKDIMLNAELLLASFSSGNSKCVEDVVSALLHNEWSEIKGLFSLGVAKVGSAMRAFALDCLLECLDESNRKYCNISYNGWARRLSSWSPEMLSRDIIDKVQRWASLSGLTPDEVIEHEMSHSLGKWTDFDVEAFEFGAEFADEMLEDVVEEITVSMSSLWSA